MYIRFTKSKKSKNPTLQIIEGYRIGKKVKQKVIASLGVIKNKKDKIKFSKFAENLIKKLENEKFPIEKRIKLSEIIHQKTIYDGFSLITDRLMDVSGFSKILQQAQGRKSFKLEEVVTLIISQRFDLPSSKLRTYERQEKHGFQNIELQHIYRTMDAIEPLSCDIQKQTFDTICAYSDVPVDCFFFDVTTLYFESIVQDELKNFGFSKDQKHHSVQIVLSLVVDAQGIPVAYEVFEGNLSETKTLIPVLETLRSRFAIKKVTVVCDRGLASKANVQALKESGFNFCNSLKIKIGIKKIKY